MKLLSNSEVCTRARRRFKMQCFLNFILLGEILLAVEVLSAEESKGYLRREHSLMKPYQGSGMTIPNWDFQGSTFVSSNYIRLTADHQSQKGTLWNNVPCYAVDWEMVIHFNVHGQGSTLFGDGFAFWYARERQELGPVFGSKDKFFGLGVFFDTYDNHNGEHSHEHPYISAMVGNGTLAYDHDTDGTHSQVSGCSALFRAADYDTFAMIRYSGTNERLTVFVDVDNKNEWRECFDVGGIKLPTGLHFGASAATGDLADNHDIISMKLYEIDVPQTEKEKQDEKETDRTKIMPFAAGAEPYREHVDDVQGSFSPRTKKIFGWLFWLAAVACVILFIGMYIYHKQQENARKRFY